MFPVAYLKFLIAKLWMDAQILSQFQEREGDEQTELFSIPQTYILGFTFESS